MPGSGVGLDYEGGSNRIQRSYAPMYLLEKGLANRSHSCYVLIKLTFAQGANNKRQNRDPIQKSSRSAKNRARIVNYY
jgi:hypothetical protein